jgi:hypothetical protein
MKAADPIRERPRVMAVRATVRRANNAPPTHTKPAVQQEADLSGWPLDPRERRDFYHRIRTFPDDVAVWRRHLVTLVMENRNLFPLLPRDGKPGEVRNLVDDGISYLRESRAS